MQEVNSELYTQKFYDNMLEGNSMVAMEFMPYIIDKLKPKSIVDIGGGQGIFCAAAKKLGVNEVLCIDGNYVDTKKLLIDKDEFMPLDLSEKFELDRRFDVALSLEVAEHIRPDAADTFVNNIVNTSNIVIFSAAIPKQGGTGHINEEWPSYWIEKFKDKGYKVSNCLRKYFWNHKNVIPLRRQNILLFIKNEKYDEINSCFEKDAEDFYDMVHPEVYMEKIRSLENQIDDLYVQLPKRKRFHMKKVIDFLKKNDSKKIALFCAGEVCGRVIDELLKEDMGECIQVIFDNNSLKTGDWYRGYEIKYPTKRELESVELIFICSDRYENEIYESLLEREIEAKKVYKITDIK